MASQAQIDANRRNAQLSTGPKPPEGKAAVSQNALKHGLRSDIYKTPMRDPKVYDQLLADLIAEHRPQTVTEEFYVERMALCLDKLTFLEGMQNDCLFTNSRDFDLSEEKALNIYWNQQERLERGFDRALATLRKLQKERRASETAPAAPAPSPASVKPDPLPAPAPTREAKPPAPQTRAPKVEQNPGPSGIGFVRPDSFSPRTPCA